MMTNSSWWGESDMVLPAMVVTANPQEHQFPLMRLPGDLRNVIYRHALNHALPNLILPRWLDKMQPWHVYAIDHSVATVRIAASSFTNLQLSNRRVYQEASYILYQTCQFSFNIAPSHASFLDACLLSGSLTPNIQDKSYIHRITNVVLNANWDGYDWAHIRKFKWTNWKNITFVVCCELQGFVGLRRLTLDWKVPHPGDVLQPTKLQWLSISPCFEWLQAKRPEVCMEVLAWEIIPGSVPSKHREIRRGFRKYAEELLEATERPRHTSAFLPNPRHSSHQGPPLVPPKPRHSSHQGPPLVPPNLRYSNSQGPPMVPPNQRFSSHHGSSIPFRPSRNPFAYRYGVPLLPDPRRSL